MTFQSAVWAVDGNQIPADFMRLMQRAASRSAQGIVEKGDLRVHQTATPGPGIIVGDGAGIVHGAEILWQGSYWAYNVGDDTTLTVSATGGTGRSDMVVARVEDPTFDGSPWTGDPTEQIVFPRILSGVSNTAKNPPSGISAIPLARIDIPASTSVITDAMIKDLRVMADPRTLPDQRAISGISPSTDIHSNSGSTFWPQQVSWNDIAVPDWASQVAVTMLIGGVTHHPAGGQFNADVWVRLTSGGTNRDTGHTHLFIGSTETAWQRLMIINTDVLSVPAAIRGTTATVEAMAQGAGSGGEFIEADGGTTATIQLLWREVPVSDEPARIPK